MRAIVLVSGVVQGVGFRPFVYRIAVANDLKGYVRNRGDAGVEIVVQGADESVEKFLSDLKARKPPLASYDSIDVAYPEHLNELRTFSILESSEERELAGSVIPPDVSIYMLWGKIGGARGCSHVGKAL